MVNRPCSVLSKAQAVVRPKLTPAAIILLTTVSWSRVARVLVRLSMHRFSSALQDILQQPNRLQFRVLVIVQTLVVPLTAPKVLGPTFLVRS